MKLARQMAVARGEGSRWKVISRQPSYHGGTPGALSLTGDPVAAELFGPMKQAMRKVPAPVTYCSPAGFDQESGPRHRARVLERPNAEGGAQGRTEEPRGGEEVV